MCGLLTFFNYSSNVQTKDVLDSFLYQKSRGREGFGFSFLTPSGKIVTKRFEEEAECFYELSRIRSRLIQFHHRNPTSTANNAFQNHPITCETKKHAYSLTHNGVIRNAEKLKDLHHKDIEYSTQGSMNFNDSECLLHELVMRIEEGKKHKIRASGSIAFIILQMDKQKNLKKMYFGRNSSYPLYWGTVSRGYYFISSENEELESTEKITGDKCIGDDSLHSIEWKRGCSAELVDCEFPIVDPLYTSPIVSGWGPNGRSQYDGVGFRRGTRRNTPINKQESTKSSISSISSSIALQSGCRNGSKEEIYSKMGISNIGNFNRKRYKKVSGKKARIHQINHDWTHAQHEAYSRRRLDADITIGLLCEADLSVLTEDECRNYLIDIDERLFGLACYDTGASNLLCDDLISLRKELVAHSLIIGLEKVPDLQKEEEELEEVLAAFEGDY